MVSQMLVFRRAFEDPKVTTFELFRASMASVRLAAPYYVVAAGPSSQGFAMARNLTQPVRVDDLQEQKEDYLVQCNTDRWGEGPRKTMKLYIIADFVAFASRLCQRMLAQGRGKARSSSAVVAERKLQRTAPHGCGGA